MRRRRLTRQHSRSRWAPGAAGVVGLAAAGVLAIAGCSSSSSSSASSSAGSSSSASAASSSAPTAASPITIGSISTLSGPEASGFAGVQQTQDAWVSYVNAHGGIDGHQVNLISLDDGGLGPTALQDAKKLIEQDHVVAIVGAMTDADPAFATYVEAEKIPVVGGSNLDTFWETNPYFFPQGMTTSVQAGAQEQMAKSAGQTKFGWLYCTELAACAVTVHTFQNYAKQLGVTMAYAAGISATQPSYTAECLAAKAAGVTALEIGEAPIAVSNVATACAAQGYDPLYIGASAEINGANLQTKALNGMLVQLTDFPWVDDSTAATREYQVALKTYQPSVLTGAGYGASSSEVWTAMQLFAAAVEAGHPGSTVTTADILNGLWSMKDQTLGGLAPPLTFTNGKPAGFVDCGFVTKDENGHWVEPQGLKTICTPAPAFQVLSS